MNKDLTYILHGQLPRRVGEMPKMLGSYERIAPSELSEELIKMVGGQKMYGSTVKINEANKATK